MRSAWKITLLGFFFLLSTGKAIDVPGGLMRTADSLAVNTYEIMLSPQFNFEPRGAYLSAELRYQANDDLGVGFGFGSGEAGFNVGTYAIWHVIPDLPRQPGFALLGGLYINRVSAENFFVLRVAPTLSETFRTSWGIVTPYGGGQISPSFRLGQPDNQFSVRASMGTQVGLDAIPGFRMWGEVGLGLLKSVHHAGIGISYPLNSFDG